MTHEIPQLLSDTLTANHSREMRRRREKFECTESALAELVHDIRQPLSTIEALTSYLELVCTDMHTRAHLERIQDVLIEANGILERASEADYH
jgi:signal transduction histidine kinase